MVAHGGGEGVGGVEVFGGDRYAQDALQHSRHLLFGGVPVASDGSLDRFWGIFRYLQPFGDGCGDGYALGPAQFEHRLWVFSVEWRFNRHGLRLVEVDDPLQPLENPAEPFGVALELVQFDDPNLQSVQRFVFHTQDGKSKDVGSGIYAQNAIGFQFFCQSRCISAKVKLFLREFKLLKRFVLRFKLNLPFSGTSFSAGFWWKTLLGALLLWLLMRQIFGSREAKMTLDALHGQRFQPNWLWLGIASALMPLNWHLEVLKWRNFLPRERRPPVAHSWKAILGGIAWSFLTPNRSGEYAGRVLSAGKQERWNAVYAAVAGAYCQFLVLTGLGIPAFALFGAYRGNAEWQGWRGFIGMGLVLLAFLLAAGLFIQPILGFLIRKARNPFWRKWLAKAEPLRAFTRRQLTAGLALATLRYLVYMFQYVAMLRFSGIVLDPGKAFAGVGTIYLVQTGLPLPPALGFLARGEIALLVWQTWPVNAVQVLVATYGLFVINLALPALVGVLWMLRKEAPQAR